MNRIVEQCEKKGRATFISFLQQIGIKDIQPTEDEYDQVDLFFTSKKGNKIAVEIKTRDKKYEYYDTYMMEEIKYNGIKQRMKEEGAQAGLYVYIFDNHIYIYNIEDCAKGEKQTRVLPKNHFSNEKTVKDMFFFRKDKALVMAQYVDNKWIRL